MGAMGFNEQRYPLMPHPAISVQGKGAGQRVLLHYTDGDIKAQKEGVSQQALPGLMPAWVWPHL